MANQSNTFHGASVSGGFNVQGNQFHGNVSIGGSCRDDTDDLQYLRLLKTVNPEDERRRILTVKDKLVTASYSWIHENETFRSWLHEDMNHLLWIKGGPGKGKTMMMAGLIDTLSEARTSEGAVALSYFFCQNAEAELRNVASIVKGLIYMLAFREKSLVHHLKKKYEADGEDVFTGPRALFTLWQVLEDMLRDFHGSKVYLIVDGLDECDDPEFDDFLLLLSGCNITTPGKIKWLVTSRPFPRIEYIIGPDQDRYRISLEVEAQHVSQGIGTFINEKVMGLNKRWSSETTEKVRSYLEKNAEGTFLWVALVCRRVQKLPEYMVEIELTKISSLQQGLDSFYERMMQVVRDEFPECAELCMRILRTTTLAYRPLHLQELGTVVALPHQLQRDDSSNFRALRDLIERCGSFILVHEDIIYFVHHSAKDYLSAGSGSRNFPLDRLQEHSLIAERCLDTLNSCLKDHQFPDPAYLSKQESGEDQSRLLSRIAYACSYWIHHILEFVSQTAFKDHFPNQEKIYNLLDTRLIAWVHTLGSLKEVAACVGMIKALLDIPNLESTDLFHIMQDTYRFLRQNKHLIEESPNHAYTSSLLFAPKSSWVRRNYQNRIPQWIKLRTRLNNTWDACLETLLGHSTEVISLAFSSDGSLLASKSEDCTRLWETETGKCRGMLCYPSKRGHLAFSPDDAVLVSGSDNGLKLLDTTTGSQRHLPIGQISPDRCLFAPNSQILAYSNYRYLELWDISTRENCGIFELANMDFRDMAFSQDSKRILVADSNDIQVQDLETSNIVATFRRHYNRVILVQSSLDSRLVLSASSESIWLWTQATANLGKRLEGHIIGVIFTNFSPDGKLILSAHGMGSNLILWETATGNKLHELTAPLPYLFKPMFSPDSTLMVIPLPEGAKSWDTTTGKEITTFEAIGETNGKSAEISTCSKDGKLFAQTMEFETRIWQVATGALTDTLVGHSDSISALEFSPTGNLIASASYDSTVKLWSFNRSISKKATYRKEFAKIEYVALSSDGSLAASASNLGGIRLWDLESGSSKILKGPNESYYDVKELIISPDNSLLAARNYRTIWIWETENGSLRYESKEWNYYVIDQIAFSPDSHLFKINHCRHETKLVENHTLAFEKVQKPPHAGSTQSGTSPDGRFFVSLGSDLRPACLWTFRKVTRRKMFRCELGEAGGVATYSPDSKLIAYASRESIISVWETETGVCHVSLDSLYYPRVVSFSHDNRFLAYTLGYGNNLSLLELSTGISWALPFPCASPARLLTFSPDASKVAVVATSAIVLWETKSGSAARKLEYDQEGVREITFLPDRDILIAGHEDGTIRSLDTKNDTLFHTLSTKDCPPRFSLDSKREFLWTGNHGFFFNEVLCPRKKSAISLENYEWVLFNGERVLWLPTESRPYSSATWSAYNNNLAIGHHSGRFTSIHFDI